MQGGLLLHSRITTPPGLKTIGFELFSRKMFVNVFKIFVPLYFKCFGSTHVFADLEHRVVNQPCCNNVFQNGQTAQIKSSVLHSLTQQKWSCVCLAWTFERAKNVCRSWFLNHSCCLMCFRRALVETRMVAQCDSNVCWTARKWRSEIWSSKWSKLHTYSCWNFHRKNHWWCLENALKGGMNEQAARLCAKTFKCSIMQKCQRHWHSLQFCQIRWCASKRNGKLINCRNWARWIY